MGERGGGGNGGLAGSDSNRENESPALFFSLNRFALVKAGLGHVSGCVLDNGGRQGYGTAYVLV
jgi:hypothetical protein